MISCTSSDEASQVFPHTRWCGHTQGLGGGIGCHLARLQIVVHRLGKQFCQLFRQTIGETFDMAGEVDAGMRHLVAILSRE